MDNLRGSLDRVLGGLRFDQTMKNAVKEKSMSERQIKRRIPLRAAVLAVCAVLVITAAAAGPGIWEKLTGELGPFAPYMRPAEGTAGSQGIQVDLAGSISDRYTARVYFTVTDRLRRLNAHTALSARLEGETAGVAGSFGVRCVSYDAEAGQLLMEASADGLDAEKPVTLTVSGLNPGCYSAGSRFSVPAEAETLKTGEAEDGSTVLLSGQNPQKNPECTGIGISSVGFDGAGCFHVRIAFDEGFSGERLSIIPESKSQPNTARYQEDCEATLVEGGIDLRFPRVTPETLGDVDYLYLYGTYQGPEAPIAGSWSVPVTLELAEQRTIDLSGKQVGNFVLDRAELSPLTLAVFYERTAGEPGFLYTIQAAKRDGSAAPLEGGLCSVLDGDDMQASYSLAHFTEPVDLDEISSISLMGEVVWTNPD